MGAILSRRSQAVLQLLIGMQNRAMGILGPLKWGLVRWHTLKGRQRKVHAHCGLCACEGWGLAWGGSD